MKDQDRNGGAAIPMPPAAGRTVGKSPTRQSLRPFGISAPVARRVTVEGEALRARTQQTLTEFATTLDAATGAPVGVVLTGRGSEVDIGAHLQAMTLGRQYVAVHTHPASTPPSAGDAEVLVANPAIRVVVVVGVDGTWYALGKASDIVSVSVQTVRVTFAAALYVLRPRFVALERARGMTREQTVAALLDAIWRAIAPRLALRYDRWKR